MWGDDANNQFHQCPELRTSERESKSIYIDGQEVEINSKINFHEDNYIMGNTSADEGGDPYNYYSNLDRMTPY
jgi:hypothetical protein